MDNTTRRFLIPAYGPDRGAIEKAIGLLQILCDQAASPRKALLLTPTRRQMDGTYLAEALGAGATKALLQGREAKLPNGSLRLATMQTLRAHERCDIVLSVYGPARMMEQIDDLLEVEAVIVVPWTPGDTAEWQQVWNPTIIENPLPEEMALSAQSGAAYQRLSPVVVEGLKLLTGLVNVSTGLSHPLDKPKAVALFRALKKGREPFDVLGVRSWAVHHGWTSRGAGQLAEVAQAILDGKRVQAPDAPAWGKEFLDTLRARSNHGSAT